MNKGFLNIFSNIINDIIKYHEEIGKKNQMPFLETSAKQNINVNEGFDLLVNELLKGKNENQIVEMFSRKTRSDLSISSKSTAKKQKKGGCC